MRRGVGMRRCSSFERTGLRTSLRGDRTSTADYPTSGFLCAKGRRAFARRPFAPILQRAGSDQQSAPVQARAGRRSHMKLNCGFAKAPPWGALVPVTEAGKMIAVIAEPGTVVPGAP